VTVVRRSIMISATLMVFGFGILIASVPALAQPSQAIPGNYTCQVLLYTLQAGMPWQRHQLLYDIEHQIENMRDLESAFGLSADTPAQREKAEAEVLGLLPIDCNHGFGPSAPLSLLVADAYLGSLADQHGIKFPPKNFGDIMVAWLNQVPAEGD